MERRRNTPSATRPRKRPAAAVDRRRGVDGASARPYRATDPSQRRGDVSARTANRPTTTRRASAAPARNRSPWAAVVFIAILVAVVALIGFGASRCSSSPAQDSRALYESPYDWADLSWNGDRLAYLQGGAVASHIGVDVSDHQGWIDWNAVAADGIDFAMVRLGNRGYTEGALAADAYFDYNLDGAQAAGLDAGVYFFSQATTPEEAREEARFVLDQLGGRTLQLPVAFDHEPVANAAGRANGITGSDLIACMEVFCETIEAAGYDTMVYGNRSDMARFSPLDGTAQAATALDDAIGGRPVWFAEYGVSTPTAPFDFAIWQYANNGDVAGIDTAVDLNILLPQA